MYNYKSTKIIGIDHGYGNIKTAGSVFHTGITEYDSEPAFSGNILEYAGKWYKVGERHKDYVPNKTDDEDYYLMTLAAIAGELGSEMIFDADVHIACGLPLTWVRHQREEFRAYLMQNDEVHFRYNGDDFTIRITGCSVFPQGYSAVARNLRTFDGTHMVADIGNGTLNIMYIVDRQAQESRCWTEKLGVNECMIRVRNAVLDRFGVMIDESTVERVFRTGSADIDEKYLSVIREVAACYVNEIFAALRKYEYSPDLVRLHIVGGGAVLVKNFGSCDPGKTEISDDICAAAKGYEFLAWHLLRKEDHEKHQEH